MAIIHHYEKVENKYHDCGVQMFHISYQRYGGSELQCFAPSCIQPVPIGRIAGDCNSFTAHEYMIPDEPYVTYSAAEVDGYQKELHAEIKTLLESWGFVKVAFEFSSKSNDTVISGVHIAPQINIKFRMAPNTKNVLYFTNKFGVIGMKTGEKENSTENDYRAWDSAYYALCDYGTANKLKIRNSEKILRLSVADRLATIAKEHLLKGRKQVFLSEIVERKEKIADCRSDIRYEQKEIAELVKQYTTTFKEPLPKSFQKICKFMTVMNNAG